MLGVMLFLLFFCVGGDFEIAVVQGKVNRFWVIGIIVSSVGGIIVGGINVC